MLNSEQKKVVTTTEGPVLVIAGPGTGKTKTLVERVLYLLQEKKLEASSIFLSTFTEKAARELYFRIQQRLQEEKADILIEKMYLGTMHSLWLRLLEEHIGYSHYQNGIEIMDEEEEHFFLYSQWKRFKNLEGYAEFFEDFPGRTHWKESRELQKIFAKIHEEAVDIDNIRSFVGNICFLQQAHALYERLLWEENKISFSYLQREFYEALKQYPEFLAEVQSKIRYFLIDEYQDTNAIQEKILLLLSQKSKNICVVGDEDQAIYRFRGASVENILFFEKHFTDCQKFLLRANYRSTEEIVSFGKRWIENIDWDGNRYPKDFYSARYDALEKNSLFQVSLSANNKKRKFLVSWLLELKEKGKIEDYSQVAFLFDGFRSPQIRSLEEDLERAGIPVYCPRARNFFNREEVRAFLGVFFALYPELKHELAGNSYYEGCLAFARILAKQNEALKEFIVRKRGERSSDFLEDYYQILAFSPFADYLQKEEEDVRKGRELYNMSLLGKMIQKFQRLCKLKVKQMAQREVYLQYFVRQYLKNYIDKGVNEFEKKGEFPKGCIPFLTFHQSKGLEFPIVFVGSLHREIPLEKEREAKDYEQLFQKKRLLSEVYQESFDFYRKYYVAFSRAKNQLIFLNYQVSEVFAPFVRESIDLDSKDFSWDMIEEMGEEKIEEQKAYSYTADILPYRLCPRKYFFQRKLAFPIQDKENLLMGTFLHKTLELSLKEGRESWEEALEEAKIQVEKKSIFSISQEQKERAKEILGEFWKQKEGLFHKLIEVEAREFYQQKGYLLYGELDLLAEDAFGNWKLIDFKTGKAKPEYREQLLLYRSLLSKYRDPEEISLSLYYLLENREEGLRISQEEEEVFQMALEETVQKIERQEYPRRDYQEEICEVCEWKYYCEEEAKALEEKSEER